MRSPGGPLTFVATLTVALVLGAAGSAAAAIDLGAVETGASAPQVVVDHAGQGYALWEPNTTSVSYCRLPQGTTNCQSDGTQSFAPNPPVSVSTGSNIMLTDDGTVVVLYSRCCAYQSEKLLQTSTDGGVTFSSLEVVSETNATGAHGNMIHVPTGTFFPGSDEQYVVADTGPVTSGGSIQAIATIPATGYFSPSAPQDTSSESLGLQGATLMLVYTMQAAPQNVVYWRVYSGLGDINNLLNWSAPQAIGNAGTGTSNAQVLTGPSGVYVARSVNVGANDQVVLQRFTGSGWTSPMPISGLDAGDRFAAVEDPAGVVHLAWTTPTGELLYRYARDASNGSFTAPRVLPTPGPALSPRLAVNAAGRGWVTWTDAGAPVAHAFAAAVAPDPVKGPPPPPPGQTPGGPGTGPPPSTTPPPPSTKKAPKPKSKVKTTSVKLSDGSRVRFKVPRKCVARGKRFTVTLSFKRARRKHSKRKHRTIYVRVSRVVFSISQHKGKAGKRTSSRQRWHKVKTDKRAPFKQKLKVKASTKHGHQIKVRARATIKVRHGRSPHKSITVKLKVC